MKKLLFCAMAAAVAACSPADKQQQADDELSAYLMAFFLDADHSLHFAISDDGYEFTALNDNKPVIAGDTIASQHGIRDPYIYRGPDGAFYMVMTDLHIFGKQAGLRDTQWDRPEEYGWGNNRGIVMLKSADLINWQHANVMLDERFPEEFGNIGCAWAPQVIYDPAEDKMMVYLTIRKTGEGFADAPYADRRTRLYYAYANPEFNDLATAPRLLYTYPDSSVQVLDADIFPMPDGRWAMTYVAQEQPGGIKIAYSDSIHSGYDYNPDQIDTEDGACEAPTMWKRIGEDKWVLMYDIFSIHPHNFGFVETTDFKTFTPLGRFNEGVMKTTNFASPKHGAVVPITASEAQRLKNLGNK